MSWEDRVAIWLQDPVTVAFRKEVEFDVERFTELLIETPIDPIKSSEYRGFIKALRGVLDMGVKDVLIDPETMDEEGEFR